MKKFGKFLAGVAALAAAAVAVVYYFEKKKEADFDEDEFDDFEDFEDDLDDILDEEPVSREYVSLNKAEEEVVVDDAQPADTIAEEVPETSAE